MRKKVAMNFQPRARIRLLPARLTVGIDAETSRACRSGRRLCRAHVELESENALVVRGERQGERAHLVVEPAVVERELLEAEVDGEEVGQRLDRAAREELVRQVEGLGRGGRVLLRGSSTASARCARLVDK